MTQFSTTACRSLQTMTKQNLLALLPSSIDSDFVIEASTGDLINTNDVSQKLININLNKRTWLPREVFSPRKLLLYNDNWQIQSFNPKRREVCIVFTNNVRASITIPDLR